MSNNPISGLPVAVAVDGSEYIPVVQSNTVKRVTIRNSLLDVSVQLQEALDGITTTQGSIVYRNGDTWTSLPPGGIGAVLKSNGHGLYWFGGTGSLDFSRASNSGYVAAVVL